MNHFKKIKLVKVGYAYSILFFSGFISALLAGFLVDLLIKNSGFTANLFYFLFLILLFPFILLALSFVFSKMIGNDLQNNGNTIDEEKKRLSEIIKIKDEK